MCACNLNHVLLQKTATRILSDSLVSDTELPWPSGYELREVAGSNPGKSHWWTTGRASGLKTFTAPAKSQLTIGHRPSPMKTGSV